MNSKIIIGKIRSYTTTDGEVFAGEGSKKEAEEYQWTLDKEHLFSGFDTFMRKIFGIKCEYISGEYSDEEQKFCDGIMKEVCIHADDGDFREEISRFILDLYGFIGPEKWLQIHGFLAKEK